ncbi:hypothetical protein Pcar_0073 [Syntrophotalea carbinolica DSM 2380]|uniref:Uncharacterized protein n=1 Tax=Syntrophotalea carbinolica (strain DSM 2380 / NBRC 103641 / GraBd1) TaxID=338963 RepID=Q3A8F6_SYNC1|nr:glycosyltransferase family 2 protein [Syntrophotalea carbinolica]ABA87336.1 hypothetical protein Pcar_0073 [Syntrophotalea carbinolica DSM 2380]
MKNAIKSDRTPSETNYAPFKITGITQCKNEWGLVALSIGYALVNHVDEVYVLNDSSTDETHAGLAYLQDIWPGRIHIYNQTEGQFIEEGQINALVGLAQQSEPDWIYFFDADEFLISRNGSSLKDCLGSLPANCHALRYALKNFILPRNFNEQSLSDYLSIEYEAMVDPSVPKESLRKYEEIYKGNLNFFHMPFPSKVIFRNQGWMHLAAGSHDVAYNKDVETLRTDQFYAAHLSWISLERLRRKADLGKTHIVNGYSKKHGWQNQLIYRIAEEDRLEELWERHSLPEPGEPRGCAPTNVKRNRDFQSAIKTTVQILVRSGFNPQNLCQFKTEPIPAAPAPPTDFRFQTLVALMDRQKAAVRSRPSRRKKTNPTMRFFRRLRKSIAKRLPPYVPGSLKKAKS